LAEPWPRKQRLPLGWLGVSAVLAHSSAWRVKPWGETRAVLQLHLRPWVCRIGGWDFHFYRLRIPFHFGREWEWWETLLVIALMSRITLGCLPWLCWLWSKRAQPLQKLDKNLET
jgi:hypothetical protein